MVCALRSFVAVLAAVSPYRSPLSTTWAAVASAAKALALFAHVMLVPHVVQFDKETMELVGWTLVVGWLATFLLLAALQVRSAVAVGGRVWQDGCPCARLLTPPPFNPYHRCTSAWPSSVPAATLPWVAL